MNDRSFGDIPPRDSFFNDMVFWAQRAGTIHHPDHATIPPLLHLVCAEWLTVATYSKSRLNQIESGIFKESLPKDNDAFSELKKLNTWKKLVPMYQEMLEFTLNRAFRFEYKSVSGRGDRPEFQEPIKPSAFDAFRDDFIRILRSMEENQNHVDRLSGVGSNFIILENSRLTQQDNRNVGRLTWLATFFIPLSFVCSLFSMQDDIGQLADTYRLYIKIAFPVAALFLGLAMLTLPFMRNLRLRIMEAWWRAFGGFRG